MRNSVICLPSAFLLFGSGVGLALADAASSSGCEIEGEINQVCFDYGNYHINTKAYFTVFTRDGQWLIRTVEDKRIVDEAGEKQLEYLRRENGSTNDGRILELVTPLKGGFSTAVIVSNNIAFGQMDGSVVGHLWLMLASCGYLDKLETNLLTPVYKPMLLEDQKHKERATWELLAGAGSLPLKVTFCNNYGGTSAVYRVTGVTNVGGALYPTGFNFESAGKKATAVVTAIRPVCTLSNLLPVITAKTAVSDRRLVQADRTLKMSYMLPPRAGVPTVVEAKQVYGQSHHQQKSPKRSPLLVALLLVTLIVPVVLGLYYILSRRRK